MQEVILVDEHDNEIGRMEKLEAHRKALLHRAFSVFIFNKDEEMLLQRRALEKYHSPGLWTNSCCSHPAPGEETILSAQRRLQEEMGFTCPLTEVSQVTYFAGFDNGLTEHEFDHLFIGNYNDSFEVNPEEVAEFKWLNFEDIDELLARQPDSFTVWFKIAYPVVKEKYLAKNT